LPLGTKVDILFLPLKKLFGSNLSRKTIAQNTLKPAQKSRGLIHPLPNKPVRVRMRELAHKGL
jgi:hypothetical protein